MALIYSKNLINFNIMFHVSEILKIFEKWFIILVKGNERAHYLFPIIFD